MVIFAAPAAGAGLVASVVSVGGALVVATEVVPAAVSSVEVLDSAQAVAIAATRHIPAQNVKSFFIGVP
ncbi:MAG: hypothetical protein ABWY39_03445 [Mycobacterium sp.]